MTEQGAGIPFIQREGGAGGAWGGGGKEEGKEKRKDGEVGVFKSSCLVWAIALGQTEEGVSGLDSRAVQTWVWSLHWTLYPGDTEKLVKLGFVRR